MQLNPNRPAQSGVTLIEVLIAVVIVSIGLLGLAGLLSLAGKSEVEAYQRVQALSYLSDMADRMAANRAVVGCYVSSNYGSGTLPSCSAGNPTQYARANLDIAAWDALLRGGIERSSTNAAVGGIVGARGCIRVAATAATYTDYELSVAWQGLEAIAPPDASLTCGAGSYGAEANRRVVSTILRVPVL
ncbi:MAG: type IV pilus modification protein PilV [Betaproteobacteria bacterium]|nr:type IV pilus modification protein PilV [Betaproteobacteria bacterium]